MISEPQLSPEAEFVALSVPAHALLLEARQTTAFEHGGPASAIGIGMHVFLEIAADAGCSSEDAGLGLCMATANFFATTLAMRDGTQVRTVLENMALRTFQMWESASAASILLEAEGGHA